MLKARLPHVSCHNFTRGIRLELMQNVFVCDIILVYVPLPPRKADILNYPTYAPRRAVVLISVIFLLFFFFADPIVVVTAPADDDSPMRDAAAT